MRHVAVLAFTAAALAASVAAAGGEGDTSFTYDAKTVNPFGSCPLVYNEYQYGQWSFQFPPCGYPSVTCGSPANELDDSCKRPYPNTNIYHPEEKIIARYFDDTVSRFRDDFSNPCPRNLSDFRDSPTWGGPQRPGNNVGGGISLGIGNCPTTCFDCASLCSAQAKSVAQKANQYDPTTPQDACNAWVFCTNPQGCVHEGLEAPSYSCTLKRIPLDNPEIQKLMSLSTTFDPYEPKGPPEGLIDKRSSGEGSDFVSGLCNVRATCANNQTLAESCDAGCGNEQQYACGGYPMTCSDGCLPSCPC